MFSKPIASLILPFIISNISKDIKMEELSPLNLMYVKGRMYAVHNLNNFGGNIELAINHAAHSRTIVAETELQHYLDNMQGPTIADKYFQAWNQLLDNRKFKENLIKEGHLTYDEASELLHYLKILNYKYNISNVTNDQEAKDYLNMLNYWYLISPYAKNPNFRAEVTFNLSNRLSEEILKISHDLELNKYSIFSYANKIIDFNSQYPCMEINPYTCPLIVRRINFHHIDSYNSLMTAANAIGSDNYKNTAGEYVKQYMHKFYPGTVFEQGIFEPLRAGSRIETNNTMVWLTYMAGNNKYAADNLEDARKLRETDYGKYKEYLIAGKIESDL